MNNTLIFIGMDTHKEFTEIAYALDGREEYSQNYGNAFVRGEYGYSYGAGVVGPCGCVDYDDLHTCVEPAGYAACAKPCR